MNAPSLLHIANLSVEVAEPIGVGETPEGLRRIIPILGGSVSGPRLEGEIFGAGADFQMFRSDGVTILEARYVLRTSDGAVIAVNNVGLRRDPPDAMARLARGEVVDPALIYPHGVQVRDGARKLSLADAVAVHRRRRAPSQSRRDRGFRGGMSAGRAIKSN